MSDIADRAAHFVRGVETYARGDHYEAHEVWEELWQDENDDDRRLMLQALIQVASAVHKAKHDVAPRGSLRLLERAREKMAGLGDDFMAIDVARLRDEIERCHVEVARQIAIGSCKIGDDFVPAVVLLGDATPWLNKTAPPVVPYAAKGAWFTRGLDAYAGGAYFEAHELWEELWRDAPEGFDRQFLQGLIQVAAAMHKAIGQHKPKPATRLLERALMKLRPAPDGYMGLQVKRLIEESERTKIVLARLGQQDDPPPLERASAPTIARALGALPH
jgi:hypothetical protein